MLGLCVLCPLPQQPPTPELLAKGAGARQWAAGSAPNTFCLTCSSTRNMAVFQAPNRAKLGPNPAVARRAGVGRRRQRQTALHTLAGQAGGAAELTAVEGPYSVALRRLGERVEHARVGAGRGACRGSGGGGGGGERRRTTSKATIPSRHLIYCCSAPIILDLTTSTGEPTHTATNPAPRPEVMWQ